MREENQINRIVRDFLGGRLTARQRKNFLRLVQRSQKSVDMERVYHSIFEQIQNLSEQELELLHELLQNEKESRGIVYRLKPLMKYAAALVVLFGVYFAYQLTRPAEAVSTVAWAAEDNIHTTHKLPDGSEITLYGNSSFVVLEYGEQSRSILLHGEADFSVMPSKTPFFVRTESGYFTKVLGTKFEVRDITERYSVAVERGRVSIGKDEEILGVLAKGDSLVAAGSNIHLYSAETNPLVFDGMRLDRVLSTINQAYDTEVALANELDGHVKCTAAFEKDLSVTEIVDVLCEMYGYTYTIEGRRIIIQST